MAPGGADRAALAVLRWGHLVIIMEMRVFVFLVEAHFWVAGRVGSVVHVLVLTQVPMLSLDQGGRYMG